MSLRPSETSIRCCRKGKARSRCLTVLCFEAAFSGRSRANSRLWAQSAGGSLRVHLEPEPAADVLGCRNSPDLASINLKFLGSLSSA